MITLIKDFIETYKHVCKERLAAKACLRKILHKHKEFKRVYETCKNIEDELGYIYHFCPKDQRQDFIQCTLDFFHYGVNIVMKPNGTRTYFGGNSYGWTKRIKYLTEYISNVYSDCYDLYKNRNYVRLEEKYKEMNDYLDNQLWGEQYSYENLLKEYNKFTSEK